MNKPRKRKQRKFRESVRQALLNSNLFLSGGNFTTRSLLELLPDASVAEIGTVTSVLKTEGILTAVRFPHMPTLFHKTKPGNKFWLRRSWRPHSNQALGIKDTSHL